MTGGGVESEQLLLIFVKGSEVDFAVGRVPAEVFYTGVKVARKRFNGFIGNVYSK